MPEIKTVIVGPNNSQIEMDQFPEDMRAESILLLAKASAAKQYDTVVALGTIDKEETEGDVRKSYLMWAAVKTRG